MSDPAPPAAVALAGAVEGTLPRAEIRPETVLGVLSQREVNDVVANNQGELAALLRRCILAVLSSGLELDDARDRLRRFDSFDLELEREERGIRMVLLNAPAAAFAGNEMIRGVREHLFAVLRDLVYTRQELGGDTHPEAADSELVTDIVFRILRHAGVLEPELPRPLVVCWGGHAIGRAEYDYTKAVGYALGLRGMDICTGCGPGAMKGPMKGATIAHAKQRVADGRYIGLTEPGIIAAEAPNPIVNQLVILPDIEKRLEAFVRIGHGLLIFPGGAGTAEELLYVLGVLADPANAEVDLPIIMTGPAESAAYFDALDAFVRAALGPACAKRYQIIINDPAAVAAAMSDRTVAVLDERAATGDSAAFNWRLKVTLPYQQPFDVTHESMAALKLSRDLPVFELASNLRRAFSGIVCGNVKEAGILAVESRGPFQLDGDAALMEELDTLLRQFVQQGRMRLASADYVPCFEIRRPG